MWDKGGGKEVVRKGKILMVMELLAVFTVVDTEPLHVIKL